MKSITFLLAVIAFSLINGYTQVDPGQEKSNKKGKMDDSSQSGRKLIESGIYEFQPTQALPMAGSTVNVMSGQYFLRIEGDITESALPFFGTSHQADLTGSGGIQFKTKMKDYKIVNNEKKGQFKISFKAGDGNDYYDIFLESGYDGLSTLRVGSYNKSAMTYFGYITKISKPEKKKFDK
jgi:hypothetical protein